MGLPEAISLASSVLRLLLFSCDFNAALRLRPQFPASWKPYLGCNILAEEIAVASPASGFEMASNGVPDSFRWRAREQRLRRNRLASTDVDTWPSAKRRTSFLGTSLANPFRKPAAMPSSPCATRPRMMLVLSPSWLRFIETEETFSWRRNAGRRPVFAEIFGPEQITSDSAKPVCATRRHEIDHQLQPG